MPRLLSFEDAAQSNGQVLQEKKAVEKIVFSDL